MQAEEGNMERSSRDGVTPWTMDGEGKRFGTATLQVKPSWIEIPRNGRRSQWQGGMVDAQDLLRQVTLVEAGQCPYPSSSFLSRFPWTVWAAGTDMSALAGGFPQHYSSNLKMSPQRLPVAQASHRWRQEGMEDLGAGGMEDEGAGRMEDLGAGNTSGFPCSNGLTA